jgi:signal transduction histidine kinase
MRRGPRNRTVRWRLTLLLATLMLLTGVVLLVLSYVLVNANLSYNTQEPASAPLPPGAGLNVGGHSARTSSRPPFTVSASGAQVAHHERSALLVQYAVILGALTLIAAVVAWLIAGRLLLPLRTITAGARRITGERLHERLALPGPSDELKDLGDTFDSMLARLEIAFRDQQLFAANAAHELRTPLGVMHAEIDLALTDKQPPEQQMMLMRLRRTVLACERLTERLLSLTRGQLVAAERQPVAFDRLVAERLATTEPAAHKLKVRDELHPVVVRGDRALLGQLVENLIENAIKHNLPQGWIEVRLRRDRGQAILEVANSGQRLADDELAGLLEPFRRAAQQRVGAGTGLGLSIVRTIVDAHDGQLSLKALGDGGLRVTVALPALPEEPDTDGATRERAANETSGGSAPDPSSAQAATTGGEQ